MSDAGRDTDAGLLRREIDLLWGTDDCGRAEPGPLSALGVPGSGESDEPPAEFVDRPPGVVLRSCRSFVLERSGTPSVPAHVRLVGSGDADADTDADPDSGVADVHHLIRPTPEWDEGEWVTLLSGQWGPWALAVGTGPEHRDQVLALCHTPRRRAGAVEAGVWTRADQRGRGLAVAVTSAWAALARQDCDAIFYSALPDNVASLGVARRLGARPLGRVWQLWPAPTDA